MNCTMFNKQKIVYFSTVFSCCGYFQTDPGIEVTVVQTDASGLKIKIIFLPKNGKKQFDKEFGSGSESE